MRKIFSILLVSFLLLTYIQPAFAATGDGELLVSPKQPVKPYEKVIAENGPWYSESFSEEAGNQLFVAYKGDYTVDAGLAAAPMVIKINESVIVKKIVVPFSAAGANAITFNITNDKGNTFANVTANQAMANNIQEFALPSLGAKEVVQPSGANYTIEPTFNLVLPKGTYTLNITEPELQVRNQSTGAKGAFIITGISFDANEKYKEEQRKWAVKNDETLTKEDTKVDELGNQIFVSVDPNDYVPDGETPSAKKAANFVLEAESLVEQITVNTYNDGDGAAPGMISIVDSAGNIVKTFQAIGDSLGDVDNGSWIIYPDLVLPLGSYTINLSENVMHYDKDGNAEFYVLASLPAIPYFDFTGTYSVSFDALKTMTIMGPVSPPTSSMSLKDFQLVILDKGDSIEIIGKYNDIPFSQGCAITERTADALLATFNFEADLTSLPYNAKIGATAVVNLKLEENGTASFTLEGAGTFVREETATIQGDNNSYSISSKGTQIDDQIPYYVMNAIRDRANAGNIPGPDGPIQAATGLLFAPLVGLVVSVITEMLKNKPPKRKIRRVAPSDDSEGETSSFFGGGDEGSSDSGDSGGGDSSSSDSEDSGGGDEGSSDSEGSGDSGSDEGSSDSEGSTDSSGDTGSSTSGDSTQDSGSQTSQEPKKDAPPEGKTEDQQVKPEDQTKTQTPETKEPETMTLQVDQTGRTADYVKDAQGQWVNQETGKTLDLDKYNRDVAPTFKSTKEFVDGQRDKLEKGDTPFDRELKKNMKDIQDKLEKDQYMNKLSTKYGASDPEKLTKIIEEIQGLDQAAADRLIKYGNTLEKLEGYASVTQVIADNAIDGLANCTGPAGRAIRAGYKVGKSIAGSAAEDGISVSSVASGAIKGAADAGSDYTNSFWKKAGMTIGSEVAGNLVSGADNATKEGLIDGTYKVVMGAVGDKVIGSGPLSRGFGGDTVIKTINNQTSRVFIKSGEKWTARVMTTNAANSILNSKISRQAGQTLVKTGLGLNDEFGMKPVVLDPLKEYLIPKGGK
jgi:hypothetical protein